MTKKDIEQGYYPLRPMQLWMINTNLEHENSTMMNVNGLVKFASEIDMQKIKKTFNEIINGHDIFRCQFVFHPETKELCQRFDGEIKPVILEKISDEEFENLHGKLAKPYKLIKNPLWNVRLFETPTAKYCYFDFYHAIIDGTALAMLILHEADIIYSEKTVKRKPPKYADYILENLKIPPEELAEGHAYWKNILKGFDAKKHVPLPDIEGVAARKGGSVEIPIQNVTRKFFSDKIYNENCFFLAASMLAVGKFNGVKSSVMSWVHNGRVTPIERRLVGFTINQLPISWDFEKDCTVEEFLQGINAKIAEGINYRKSLDMVYNEGLENDLVTFIFQKTIYGDFKIGDTKNSFSDIPDDKYSAAENVLDIEINLKDDDSYSINLDYDASLYSESAMKNLAAMIDEFVLKLQDEQKFISEILF